MTRPLSELRGPIRALFSDIDGTMTTAAQPLSDADIVNLVHYIATLGD